VTSADVLYAISALCIVLGFIALLKQRLYIDAHTQRPTAVELPFFGKLKTNYPALFFVFVGAGLALEAIRNSPPTEEWTLTGSLKDPPGKHVKWSEGTFTLIPHTTMSRISDTGLFEIHVPIEKGKSIETVYDTLDYTAVEGNVQIDLRKEYQASKRGEDSLIKNIATHHRKFKPIPINTRDIPP
jgi:hypothetical protein